MLRLTSYFLLRAEELVEVVNLMEEKPEPVQIEDGSVTLAFRPFEIKTLRIS